MGRNAFETAVEVVQAGYSGQEAVEVWMAEIERLGQRYCALALDVILAAPDTGGEAPVSAVTVEGPEVTSWESLFEGMFSFPEVPAEPAE